jgi:multimeric flavodoxin WrbA
MKILGLCGSPRKGGNTEFLVKEALQTARQEGAETELYSLAGKNIAPCQGCRSCSKTARCRIEDDMQELYPKLLEADGIIFGTPVYFYNMTSLTKAVIDRTFSLNSPEKSLANKVGGVIVTAGSLGIADTLKELYFYMVTRQIVPANFVAAYPGSAGELQKMEKCMQATRELGQQIVMIVRQGFKYPDKISRTHIGYGTHTR